MPRRRSKKCSVCEGNLELDYKDYKRLRRFTNRLGKILPRRTTGLCAKHQRKLAREIKRARNIGLLSYGEEHGRSWG